MSDASCNIPSKVSPRPVSRGGASAKCGRRGFSRARQQRERLSVLCQPVVRQHMMKDLTKEEIQTMVDLAYWSDFNTSRRDAASAFATLSMNDRNLEVLDRAGVLGALLALIAKEVGAKHALSKASIDCLQDASSSLRRMLRRDEIKERFLKAPGGLRNVLSMTGSEITALRHSAVGIMETLCSYPPAQPAIVRAGGARVLVAQLASDNEGLRRTAARVLRGLSCSVHTSPQSLMDADIIRFMLCLLEGDDSAEEQQEMLCIEYFTKISSDDQACASLAELGVSCYLIGVLPERRLSLENRLSMLQALERVASSRHCEAQLISEGLFPAMISLTFNEIAGYIQSCRHYLHQHAEMESAAAASAALVASSASPPSPHPGPKGQLNSARLSRSEGREGREGAYKASGVSVDGYMLGVAGGQRKAANSSKYTEERLEVAMDLARTCTDMFSHLAHQGHCEAILHSGVLAHLNSVPIGDGNDPHMMRSVSQLVLELSLRVTQSEEMRLSFVAQGPLDAIRHCFKGDRVGQQQCALDALAQVCCLPELHPLVFVDEVLDEVVVMAKVHEHAQSAAIVLHEFSKNSTWRVPLIKRGCLGLLVEAMSQAMASEDSSSARRISCASTLIAPVVATIKELTQESSARRALIDAGGVPCLMRLKRGLHGEIRADAITALENIGYRDREIRGLGCSGCGSGVKAGGGGGGDAGSGDQEGVVGHGGEESADETRGHKELQAQRYEEVSTGAGNIPRPAGVTGDGKDKKGT